MKRLIVLSLILTISVWAFGARKALIIGNASYADKPLRNPANDAELMATTLDNLNFSVSKLTNVNHRAFDNAVREFANNLDLEDEVVFYYSGHGVQISGENYLLPVGESFKDESDFEDKAINLNWITAKLNSTAITMVFLDACRDNPFTMYRSGAKGLAMSGGGNNTFIMYSTEAGSVANDGKGKNSDFTKSLSSQMQKPGLSLDDISTNVTAEVRDVTNNDQRPWKIGSLSYKYYFTDPVSNRESGSDRYANNGRNNTPYSGNRMTSTVEERLKRKTDSGEFYNPPVSKYVKVLTANEMLVYNPSNDDPSQGQFVSQNCFGLKVPFAGVEGFYKVIKTWQNNEFDSGHMVSQMGVGAGLPDPLFIRLFAYALQNDLSDVAPYESYMGFKAELAKRVRTAKQFTELGISVEMNETPDLLMQSGINPISSYFESSTMNWTPNRRLNAYLMGSSLNNRYLEPNNFQGLGSATNPLLYANCQGSVFMIRCIVEERENDQIDTRDMVIDAMLPLNFNKYFGLDLGYKYNQFEDFNAESSSNSTDISGAVRLCPLCFESFRLIGSAKYNRHKQDVSSEVLDFSAHMIIKLSHHFAILGIFQHSNTWLRDEDFTKLDPQGYFFGSAITARL